MKAIRLIIIVLCSAVFFLTACGSKAENNTEELDTKENEPVQEETSNDELKESLEGLVENEYEDLEITAAVLERMAILPGSTIPLSVTIANNGDKNIAYAMGSGSFETPQAIMMEIPGLQPILARDHLGIATMDMRNNELLPGESIQYTLYIRAIQPNESFHDYTYNKWNDGEQYIGDIEWNTLQEDHSDLTAAKPGTYEGTIYFLYYINDAEQVNPTLNATGYSSGAFSIGVSD